MHPEREISLDMLVAGDWDYPPLESSPEDAVVSRFEMSALRNGIATLNADERELIKALFFGGRTEREYSKCRFQSDPL